MLSRRLLFATAWLLLLFSGTALARTFRVLFIRQQLCVRERPSQPVA